MAFPTFCSRMRGTDTDPIGITPRDPYQTVVSTLQVEQVDTPRGSDSFSSRASSHRQRHTPKEGLCPQLFLVQILSAQHCKV